MKGMSVADLFKWMGQVAVYFLFCLLVWFFSIKPSYFYLQPDQAEVRIAFRHTTEPIEPCIRKSKEDLAKLPPNRRLSTANCVRGRAPLMLQVWVDDKEPITHSFRPSGLWKDGSVYVHAKFSVPAGDHRLTLGINDNVRHEGLTDKIEQQVTLTPGQALIIGFNTETRSFYFH